MVSEGNLSKRIEAVFFDLHGTLVTFDVDDVEERIRAAYQAYAASLPFPASWHKFVQVWMKSRAPLEKLARESLQELQIADVAARTLASLHGDVSWDAELLKEMVRSYTHVWVRHLSLSPGSRDILQSLRSAYKLALVSNYADTATVWQILHKFDLASFFQAVVVSADVGWRKPHPAIFLEALKRTGSRPQGTIHVGDEPDHDVAGAEAVGITGILYDPIGKYPAFNGRRVASLSQLTEFIRKLEGNDGT